MFYFMRRSRRLWSRKSRKIVLSIFVTYLLCVLLLSFGRQGSTEEPHAEKEEPIPVIQQSTIASPFSPELVKSGAQQKVAYAVVITNEDFVDGALVVGFSIKQQSNYVREGIAELVLIFPPAQLSLESQGRLRCAGWSNVLELPDLSAFANNARMKDTFNKLHVFNLTQYSRVAMFDGDMLMLRNPDAVFHTTLENEKHIGAIGSSSHSYFQTGMMFLIPSSHVFVSLMRILRSDKFQLDPNRRDGSLIRAYFEDRYVILDHMFSIHVRPDSSKINKVVGAHYRGSWKPWFDKEYPPDPPKRQSRSEPGQELGAPYRLWWETYEELHKRCMQQHDRAGILKGYDPSESMWLMRHTTKSYIQPMRWVEARRRNLTYVGLRIVRSSPGASCSATCAEKHNDMNKNNNKMSRCVEAALSFTSVNDKTTLRRHFKCTRIKLDDPAPHQPSFNTATETCHVNSLDGKRERPTCDAHTALHRRLCTCVDADILDQHPDPIPYGQPESNTPHTMNNEEPNVKTEKDAKKKPQEEVKKFDGEGNHASRTMETDCLVWSPGEVDPAISRRCAKYLAHWDYITRIEYIPIQRDARTIKLRLHYGPTLRAVMKLEQVSFPLEPHAEYGAYVTSLLLHIAMVPPTAMMLAPKSALRSALLDGTQKEAEDFLRHELYWLRSDSSDSTATVPVSVQLWFEQNKVIPFAQSTPPITLESFERWLRVAPTSTRRAEEIDHETLMYNIATMIFFDFVIGNEDRTFTHNAFVLGAANGTSPTRVILLDHGKSLCFATDPRNNVLSNTLHGQHQKLAADGGNSMCKLPANVLRGALPFSRSHRARRRSLGAMKRETQGTYAEGRAGLDGQMLRSRPGANVTWQISEENVLAAQVRLERALDHFARCANLFGLSYVTGVG